MRERRRAHRSLIVILALVLAGSSLLVLGLPFVSGWLAFLNRVPNPTPPPICGGNQCIITIALLTPPDPYPLLTAYTLAIPSMIAIGWWIRKAPRSERRIGEKAPRVLRSSGVLLIGAMAWMGLFIATGFAMDWLAIPVLPSVRDAFLASVLGAPSIVLGVAAVYVWSEWRRRLSGRSPAAPG